MTEWIEIRLDDVYSSGMRRGRDSLSYVEEEEEE